MKHKLMAATLTAAMALGSLSPALADGKASTRNIVIFGTAAGIAITNYNHKVRLKRAQQQARARRQAACRRYHRYC